MSAAREQRLSGALANTECPAVQLTTLLPNLVKHVEGEAVNEAV